jgi:hypothetical protein
MDANDDVAVINWGRDLVIIRSDRETAASSQPRIGTLVRAYVDNDRPGHAHAHTLPGESVSSSVKGRSTGWPSLCEVFHAGPIKIPKAAIAEILEKGAGL